MKASQWKPQPYKHAGQPQEKQTLPQIYPAVRAGGFSLVATTHGAAGMATAENTAGITSAANRELKRTRFSLVNLRKLGPRYLIASFLLLLLILTAIFGSQLMPHPIDDSQRITFVEKVVNGQTTYLSPPLKQSAEHWFGTDHRGIDVLSLLLNGMKYTLGFTLVVVLCRFLIGIPLGLLGGSSRLAHRVVQIMQLTTSSVPAIILLLPAMYSFYLLLYMDTLIPGDEWKRNLFTLLMFGCISFVGFAPIARQVADRTRFYVGKDFVVAARTLGASRLGITWRHVLPNLRAELFYMFLSELVQVMFLLGQLAVMGIFLGGANILDLEDGMPTVRVSPSGEWCAMIAYGSRFIQFHPQILLGTALFFTLTVVIIKFFLAETQKLNQPLRGN
jgi:ABC-type dipeptide/oligopeptide/nickel transport system permease subunit